MFFNLYDVGGGEAFRDSFGYGFEKRQIGLGIGVDNNKDGGARFLFPCILEDKN